MYLSVFNPILYNLSLEDALKFLSSHGVNSLELGCGGYPGTSHADAKELITDFSKLSHLKELLAKYNFTISAL